MLAFFTIYLVVALLALGLATGLAHIKHRTWLLWGIMSLFFPPVVLVLIFLPARSGPAPYEEESIYGEEGDIDREDGGYLW